MDDFYICSVCGRPVDENGNDAVYHEPTGSHTLTMIPEKEPTYEEDGYRSHWYCQVCDLLFSDAAGTMPIENVDELILPKLTDNPDESQQVIITSGLAQVPQEVSGQYSSVDAIYKALVNAAILSDENLSAQEAQSVLLDVELQIRDSDGNWVAVTPENFPEEGIEVLLPYPDGTNPDDFTFVVTHMITSGEKAGEIEILPCTPEPDGLRVRFTSLSPVCITYQEKAAPVQAGDTSCTALWAALLLVSASALALLLLKRKSRTF